MPKAKQKVIRIGSHAYGIVIPSALFKLGFFDYDKEVTITILKKGKLLVEQKQKENKK